jgi:heat-inducible transcriptional repressor
MDGSANVLDERKLDVLRAIVEDYVSTNEPVGSKGLVDRHRLGVSPATIRNDMAVLEEEGYIAQPHTSAGRVPTDKGYRLFVDRLATVKPLSLPERRAIEHFLDGAVDLDDVVHRTVRLLSQLTRQVAVVQYPSLSRSSVLHVELVALSETRLLVVLISDTGRVEQRVVDLPERAADDAVHELRMAVNERLVGKYLVDAPELLADLSEQCRPEHRVLVRAVLSALVDALVEHPEERVLLGGTANLASLGADFSSGLRPLLEALEEHVVLLRLLGEVTDSSAVKVSIGEENPYQALHAASVVTTGYGAGEQPLAALGVLGPTRMDYPGTMGAVRAVARYLGRVLAES